jgi:hypothetical protein
LTHVDLHPVFKVALLLLENRFRQEAIVEIGEKWLRRSSKSFSLGIS